MDGLFIGVFMQLRFFLFASIATLFLGCSSISMPKARVVEHDAERTIPAIDEMIVEMKQDYITKCYAPVVKRDPPENSCQTELFQMLERRYHTNYSQNHVSMASNDLFFRDVEVQLKKMVRTDPDVRNAVKNGAFRSADEMLSYYKGKYAFELNQ
jgi:hypothetical protein